jgi:hypothetical protein
MDSLLVDSVALLTDHMTSLPDPGMAEEMDFEVWGKKFCELLVSIFDRSIQFPADGRSG